MYSATRNKAIITHRCIQGMKKNSSPLSELTGYVNQERLTFLVDGVFAITMTLLVLELRPPDLDTTNLAVALQAMLPRLYIYLIAFYSIANHWVVHQRMFRHITDMDTTMLWLSILSLLFITLIPAATAIVGRFPGKELAIACFSANSFLQAMTVWMFWAYVVKNQKQFARNSDPRLLAITSQVWLIIAIGWLISIPLGFINVYIAYAAWIILPNAVGVWGNRRRHRLQGKQAG
jgi:uncharacterized membrane protein